MRDRDAAALVRDISLMVASIAERIGPARARLRTWKESGLPASAGGGSNGGESHSDPVARAVIASEIVDRENEAKHVGWRKSDPFDDRLRAMDRQLVDLHSRATRVATDLEKLLDQAPPVGDLVEDGCQLCNAARLPVNAETGQPEHACDADCARRDHRPLESYQPVHIRRAPKPPAGVERPNEFTDVVADLPRCKFHYDFAARYGVDCHRDITLWHLDHLGSQLDHLSAHAPLVMIRTLHPDQYARSHAPNRRGVPA